LIKKTEEVVEKDVEEPFGKTAWSRSCGITVNLSTEPQGEDQLNEGDGSRT
jgi:hypothetical protein